MSLLLLYVYFPVITQPSRISGTVLDSLSREPLAGATVVLLGTTMGTTTANDGSFTIPAPGSTPYALKASMIGYASSVRRVTRGSGDSLWMQFLLAPDELESPMVVVTGTRTRRSIADVAVRVEAIPEEEVEEKLLMTPSSISMLLNESTGMRVQTTSAASNTANLRIQGLNGRYTLLLYDGIPALGGLAAGFGLTQILPLDLRQVEVLKGATSTLYGADAIAGVVNLIPKVPGEIQEMNILLNGTTQKGKDVAAYASRSLDGTGLSLLTSYNTQESFDVDGDGFADVSQFDRLTLTSRIRRQFSEDFSVRLSLSFQNEHRVGGTMDRGPFAYSERIDSRRVDATSHIDWAVSGNSAVSAKLAMLTSTREAVYGTTPFNAGQKVWFADVQYSIDGNLHNLLAGFSYRVDDVEDRTPNIAFDRSYAHSVPSLFAQDEILVTETMTLLAAARIDFHDTYGTFFVPRFSVMFKPSPAVALRLGGGTGFKAPTIFVEEAEEVGFRNVRPISGARPEKAVSGSMDANVRGVLGPFSIDGNAAVFITRLTDPLIADHDSLGVGVVYLRNSPGVVRSVGAEVSVRISYKDVKVSAGYTWLNATEEQSGSRTSVELNPVHSLGIVAFYENPEQHLRIGFENYYTGQQRVERNPYRTKTPPYWITGFIVEQGFGPLRVFVNLENIFDTRQTRFEPLIAGNPATGSLRTLPVYAPLEGRVVNAGIRYVLHHPETH